MKKYMSILMMCARQSVYKLLAVLAVMFVWEWILVFQAFGLGEIVYINVCAYVDFRGPFFCSWIAFMVILSKYGCKMRGPTGNLLRRLQVPGGKIFLLQGIYNFASFFILWGTQIMIYMAIALVHFVRFPERWGPQTLFIEIIDVFVLPSPAQLLIPLTNLGKWIVVLGLIFISSLITSGILCANRVEELV